MKGKKKTMPKNDVHEETPFPSEEVPSPSVSDSDDSDYEDSSADDDESSVSLDSQSESELEVGSPENGSSGDLEAAESESSLDEDFVNGEGSGSESSDLHQQGAESDSSEDEVAPRNTIGDVPLKWYEDEPHIGYDIKGKKIKKKEKQDKLDSFLANVDDSKNWRKIYDEYNDEVVELTKDEIKLVRRLLKNQAPHSDFDPYPDYVDWYKWEDAKHPLSNAPEPKRRFIPSKWEAKKVMVYKKSAEEKSPTLKRYSDKALPNYKNATHEVKINYEYKSSEDPDKVVPPYQRVKGYPYGPQIVPISSVEWDDVVKFKPKKGVKLLGFTDSSNVFRINKKAATKYH